MKPKRQYVGIPATTYKQLRGACHIAEVQMSDALDWGAWQAIERLRDGWRPPHEPRDTTTGLGEAAE